MVGATVVTGFGALPAHASLPLTFSHMVGLPRHDAPVDVAVDGAGDVYVTDLGGTSSNDRIVKYDPNGIFLDVLAGYGSSPGDIVNPTSITIAPNGNIYVVENGAASSLANEISYYDSGGAFLGSWGAYGIGNGQFKNPLDIAIDSVGNVYVADNVNDRIQKFASNGVWLNSWAVNNPTGVAVDGSDTVWVVTANTVKSYNTSGGLLGSFGSTNAYSLAAGPTGDLWVSASSGLVRRYDTTGTLLETLGSGQLTSPQGLAMQSDGTLYVADTGDGRVVRYGTPSKETSWAVTGVTGLTTSGGSIVAARGASTVATYSTGGAAGTSWASNGARGVTPDGSGNLWVSSMADGVVREYDGSNNLLTTVGATQLSSPRGVSFGGGKLFVADTGNDRIVRYLTDGTLDLSWPATGVRDVLVNSGTVWATDGSDVKTYTTDGVAGPWWASAGATGIAIDGSGNVSVSSSSGVVREYTIGGTLLIDARLGAAVRAGRGHLREQQALRGRHRERPHRAVLDRGDTGCRVGGIPVSGCRGLADRGRGRRVQQRVRDEQVRRRDPEVRGRRHVPPAMGRNGQRGGSVAEPGRDRRVAHERQHLRRRHGEPAHPGVHAHRELRHAMGELRQLGRDVRQPRGDRRRRLGQRLRRGHEQQPDPEVRIRWRVHHGVGLRADERQR